MKIDPAWVIVAVTILTALLIPALVLMIRGAIKWTRTEDQVWKLVEEVKELVAEKEQSHEKLSNIVERVVDEQNKAHREMYEQMRVDREATDRRLRFIEEYWMKRGQGDR